MNALYKSDFNIHSTQRGQVLVVNRKGAWIVLFKLSTCNACVNAEQILATFIQQNRANHSKRVNIGIVTLDDSRNQTLARMSSQTTTTINAVPLFIGYNDGIPVARHVSSTRSPLTVDVLHKISHSISQSAQPSSVEPTMSSDVNRVYSSQGRSNIFTDQSHMTPYNVPWDKSQ